MITTESIGEDLKSLREHLGITQDQLCERSGLKRNQIISIEKSKSNYTIGNFLRYLNGLGANIKLDK